MMLVELQLKQRIADRAMKRSKWPGIEECRGMEPAKDHGLLMSTPVAFRHPLPNRKWVRARFDLTSRYLPFTSMTRGSLFKEANENGDPWFFMVSYGTPFITKPIISDVTDY